MRIFNRRQASHFICLFLAGFTACTVMAQNLPSIVADALTRAQIPVQSVGTYVQEVGSPRLLIASNSMMPLNPASTMKLVTTQAALELLGPVYTWKTRAYADGRQVGDVLLGDLAFKGGGDPKLVVENFWLFLRQIRASGIRDIRGSLVLDRSAFAPSEHDAVLFDGDAYKPYNAGPDALLLSFKTLQFRFSVDEASNTVRVVVDPSLAGYPLVMPKLTSEECGDWRAKLQPAFDRSEPGFGGSFSRTCGEKTWTIHPYQMSPNQYFGAVFRQMWRDLGGSFNGEVRSGVVTPEARLVAEWASPTLPEVIRDINKFSNNVMARQLLLTLGADMSQLPGTPELGAQAIKIWLSYKGIASPELIIENGSGLSRIERISAGTMGRMLVAGYRASTMPEFISSMPLVGYDGTMRRRLTDQAVAGNAHIKTGSLNAVRAIAGYVLAASGKRYVVVCMINDVNAARGRGAQDALLQWIYENG
jgi:D-alanyl-D-alanine carboxypeptidase/D-alanyl-D-alanine-endopeptidase (penicillin-binding protein 4)